MSYKLMLKFSSMIHPYIYGPWYQIYYSISGTGEGGREAGKGGTKGSQEGGREAGKGVTKGSKEGGREADNGVIKGTEEGGIRLGKGVTKGAAKTSIKDASKGASKAFTKGVAKADIDMKGTLKTYLKYILNLYIYNRFYRPFGLVRCDSISTIHPPSQTHT